MTRKIILVNRYGPPDFSATSQLLSDLGFHLASRGLAVEIIASRQGYDNPNIGLAKREIERGVTIRRVWTTHFGRASLAGRAIDYTTFYVSAACAVLRIARRGDILIAKTDPPMLSSAIAPFARWRGARVVNWLQDVFPEVAQALGMPGARSGLVARLARWRTRSLCRADTNVVIGERMRTRLVTSGVPGERVEVIHNWADGGIVPLAHADNALRDHWNLSGKFVVEYSGNLGRGHEFETLLGAAQLLRAEAAIVFLFIGGGHRVRHLQREVEVKGLGSAFRFQEYQPREMLSQSLGAGDVHWISLRPELEGLIVPSKFYGILAAARPVLMVGDPHGELGRLVTDNACGLALRIGDSQGLAAAIRELREDATLRLRKSECARQLYDERFAPPIALARWVALLAKVEANASTATPLPHQ